MFGKEYTNQKIKNDKTKLEYKLIIGDKIYRNTGCTTDLEGNRFCIFERRNGLAMDRIKLSKLGLDINHKTGECRLKVKV